MRYLLFFSAPIVFPICLFVFNYFLIAPAIKLKDQKVKLLFSLLPAILLFLLLCGTILFVGLKGDTLQNQISRAVSLRGFFLFKCLSI